jgi:hypothetical protein
MVLEQSGPDKTMKNEKIVNFIILWIVFWIVYAAPFLVLFGWFSSWDLISRFLFGSTGTVLSCFMLAIVDENSSW